MPDVWRRTRPDSPSPLFVGRQLRDELSSAAQMAVDMLMSWHPDQLLNAAEADLADQLVRLATFKVPALGRSEAYLEPPKEIRLPGSEVGRPIRSAVVTRFTLVVPITGQASLLRMTTSTWTPTPVDGDLDEQSSILRLYSDGLHEAAEVRASFEQQLDEVEKRLT